jgi:hypothetical protein
MSVTSVPGDAMQSELGGEQQRHWSWRTLLEAEAMRGKHNDACRQRVSAPNMAMR